METGTMKCSKCGGAIKKVDESTMKCEKCGAIDKGDKSGSAKEATK